MWLFVIIKVSKRNDRNVNTNGSQKKKNGHFSMRDEARHTTHSHEIFGSNARQLRHAAPIQFVSAGSYDPSKIQRLDEQSSSDEILEVEIEIGEDEEQEMNGASEDFEDEDDELDKAEEDGDITKLANGRGLSMQALHLDGIKSTLEHKTNGQNGVIDDLHRVEELSDVDVAAAQQAYHDALFVVDTLGDANLATKVQYRPMPAPQVRSTSPEAPSSESEDGEKVVFVPKGKRGANTPPLSSEKQKPEKVTSEGKQTSAIPDQNIVHDKEPVQMDSIMNDLIKDILIEDDVLDEAHKQGKSNPPTSVIVEDVVMTSAVVQNGETVEEHTVVYLEDVIKKSIFPAPSDRIAERITEISSSSITTKTSISSASSPRNKKANGRAKNRRKSNRKSHQTLEEEEGDAIIADFIANMEENLSDADELLAFASRDLGGDLSMNLDDPLEASTSYSKTVDELTVASRKQFWDYVQDDDQSSVPDVLILDKRAGADVVEYYITWEGEPDSAFWIDAASLNEHCAQVVEDYEIQMMSSSSDSLSDDDGEEEEDASDISDEDEDNEMLDEEEDDNDDVEGGIPDAESLNGYKTDELLAILIQEQEYQLAGGNSHRSKGKVVSVVAGDGDDDDDEFDPDELRAMMSGKQGKRVGKYHSATKLADAFERFESSNSRLGGGRKGKARAVPMFNLSDSEAEAALVERWSNDRKTKRMKKMEREAARSQGTLSKSSRVQFLRKYENGMKVEDIHRELKVFLLSDVEWYVTSADSVSAFTFLFRMMKYCC